MRITAGLGVLVLLTLMPFVDAQEGAEKVGRFGDPAHLSIVGAESFTADEIGRATGSGPQHGVAALCPCPDRRCCTALG